MKKILLLTLSLFLVSAGVCFADINCDDSGTPNDMHDMDCGGLNTDVSGYTGLAGFSSGTLSEVDTSAEFQSMVTGRAIGTDIQAYSANMDTDSTDDYTVGGTDVPVSDGGTGASTLTDGGLLVGAAAGPVEALSVGLTTQILVGGGAGINPAWGTDIPTAVTIGSAYIYRAGGTDVPDADVADDITASNYLPLAGGTMTGDIVITESADHSSTPGAGYGYVWVRNDAPSTLIFTDDAGTDHDLTAAGTGNVSDNTAEAITGVWEIQDDTLFNFGNDADFGIRYDETTDDQLEIVSNSASDTEINVANSGAGATNLTLDGTVTAESYSTAATSAPGVDFEDQDAAAGTATIYANSSGGAYDIIMTLGVEDSGGEDQGYIECDGVAERVDILQATTIGDGGTTNYVAISAAGVITFNGSADVDLPANSVDEGDMSDNSVDSDSYVDGSIDYEHLATSSVGVVTASKAANYTVGTDDAKESYGGVIYVTSAATITLPAVSTRMAVTVVTIGAIAVSVDTNASDRMYLDGTALDDGDKATNTSTTGDMIVCTYESANGWYCASGSPDGDHWTDGGA
jgi:hypothetical protein